MSLKVIESSEVYNMEEKNTQIPTLDDMTEDQLNQIWFKQSFLCFLYIIIPSTLKQFTAEGFVFLKMMQNTNSITPVLGALRLVLGNYSIIVEVAAIT